MVDLIRAYRIPFRINELSKDYLELLGCLNFVRLNHIYRSDLNLDPNNIYFFEDINCIDICWYYKDTYPDIYICILDTKMIKGIPFFKISDNSFSLTNDKIGNDVRYLNYHEMYDNYLKIYGPLLLFKDFNIVLDGYNVRYLNLVDSTNDYRLLRKGFDYDLLRYWFGGIL